MDSSLDGIKAVFLDLDGTIYLGNDMIEGAMDFLKRCDEQGVKRFFLSNNSSKSTEEYVSKLSSLGIPATSEEVLLSTHDLIAWLDSKNVTETYLVGTSGMADMLEMSGVETKSEFPEFVVLGYDTEINYEKLSKASVHLHNGVPMVASHPDIVCPSPNGGLPDVGAYLALFESTCGVAPSHICGKPNPDMILNKAREIGVEPYQCAMVGDRLYTDMEMAERAGVVSVLVLSGEATRDDLVGAPQKPDVIVDSVNWLLR